MTETELHEYILQNYKKEDEANEWKDFSNLKHNISAKEGRDVISNVSAISNMEGGEIIIGIEDKTAKIIGIDDFHSYTTENLPIELLRHCINLSSEGLSIDSITTSDTDKTIWIIHVPKHLPRQPVIAHKYAWQRAGESTIRISEERLQTILNEYTWVVDDWSSNILLDATIDDLDQDAILLAKQNFLIKNPKFNEELKEWDDKTFLNKAKITIKDQITNAAILLLGKPESLHYLEPAQPRITWILKNNKNIEMDYEHFSIPFLTNVDNVLKKIRNLRYRYLHKENTLFPEEIDTYDPVVIREALNNCIAHQDYNLGGRILLVENPDNLIFKNAGPFLPKSIENVIIQDSPQAISSNPFLIDAMLNINMIDSIGSGIKRMFTVQKERFFPLPDYNFDDNHVSVTIFGKVLDLEYARLLVKNPDLSLLDIMLLDKVQKKKSLSSKEVKYLKEQKLIEGRKPNFIISSNLAKTIDKKAVYIKNRTIKDEHYKRLILDYIDNYGEASRSDIDELLLEILSSVLDEKQKKNKIKNIIYTMSKKDKSIINTGTIRYSKWKRNTS